MAVTTAAVVGAGASIYSTSQGGKASKKQAKKAQAQAAKDFARRSGEWRAFWNERLPRMTEVERRAFEKINGFIDKYQPLIAKSYDEQSQEKVYREYVNDVNALTGKEHGEIVGQIEQIKRGELDPVFKQKTTEAEHELRRGRADALNEFFQQNARNVARGGTSGINAERQDEARSRGYARAADESRALARSQVEDTLFKALGQRATTGQNLIANKQALIPQYQTLAEKERARIEGALSAEMGLEGQRMVADRSYADAIDKMLTQQYSTQPQYQDPGAQYQEPNRGQQAVDYAEAVVGDLPRRSLLSSFGDLWNRANGGGGMATTAPSPWADPAGNTWLQELYR